MISPLSLLAVIILVALTVWIFVQGGWRSPSTALLIALTILIVLRLLGLWEW